MPQEIQSARPKGVGQLAEEIVDAIIRDVGNISGLDNGWNAIDAETQAQIRSDWIMLARRKIELAKDYP